MTRNRIVYFLLTIITLLAGLASRHFASVLPQWVHSYLGDMLWALMVFLMAGFIFNRKDSLWIAIYKMRRGKNEYCEKSNPDTQLVLPGF